MASDAADWISRYANNKFSTFVQTHLYTKVDGFFFSFLFIFNMDFVLAFFSPHRLLVVIEFHYIYVFWLCWFSFFVSIAFRGRKSDDILLFLPSSRNYILIRRGLNSFCLRDSSPMYFFFCCSFAHFNDLHRRLVHFALISCSSRLSYFIIPLITTKRTLMSVFTVHLDY